MRSYVSTDLLPILHSGHTNIFRITDKTSYVFIDMNTFSNETTDFDFFLNFINNPLSLYIFYVIKFLMLFKLYWREKYDKRKF